MKTALEQLNLGELSRTVTELKGEVKSLKPGISIPLKNGIGIGQTGIGIGIEYWVNTRVRYWY